MPRFFFDLQDGILIDDKHGVELAGLNEAIAHAQQMAAELAVTPTFADGSKWRWTLAIRDEGGDIVHRLRFADYDKSQFRKRG